MDDIRLTCTIRIARQHAHVRLVLSNDLPSTTDGYQLINRRVEGKLFPLLLPHRRPLRPPTAYRDTTWSPLCSSFPSHSFSPDYAFVSSLSHTCASDNQPLSSFVSFPSGLVGCARGTNGSLLRFSQTGNPFVAIRFAFLLTQKRDLHAVNLAVSLQLHYAERVLNYYSRHDEHR